MLPNWGPAPWTISSFCLIGRESVAYQIDVVTENFFPWYLEIVERDLRHGVLYSSSFAPPRWSCLVLESGSGSELDCGGEHRVTANKKDPRPTSGTIRAQVSFHERSTGSP
jgi:hypothetical protein